MIPIMLQIPNTPMYLGVHDIIKMLKEQFMCEIGRKASFDSIYVTDTNEKREMYYGIEDYYGRVCEEVHIEASQKAFALWDAIHNLEAYVKLNYN